MIIGVQNTVINKHATYLEFPPLGFEPRTDSWSFITKDLVKTSPRGLICLLYDIKVLLYLYVMLYHDAEIAPSQLQSQHSGKSEYFRSIHSVLPNPWNQELVDQILN